MKINVKYGNLNHKMKYKFLLFSFNFLFSLKNFKYRIITLKIILKDFMYNFEFFFIINFSNNLFGYCCVLDFYSFIFSFWFSESDFCLCSFTILRMKNLCSLNYLSCTSWRQLFQRNFETTKFEISIRHEKDDRMGFPR